LTTIKFPQESHKGKFIKIVLLFSLNNEC